MYSSTEGNALIKRTWMLILVLATLCDGAHALQNQQDQPAPPSPQQVETQATPSRESVPAAVAPSPDAIQANLKQIQEAGDLSEEAKTKASDFLNQSLKQLEIAAHWAGKAAEFENARVTAPEALKAIQEELSQPAVELAPEVPAGASSAELEQSLKQAEAELEAAKKTHAELDAEKTRRAKRRTEIPQQLVEAQTRLATIKETPATSPAPEQATAITAARQTQLQAQQSAVEREVDCYEKELQSYDARGDLLKARLDRAARRIRQLEKLVLAWQVAVQDRRQAEATRAVREARARLEQAHPLLRSLAVESAKLAERRGEISLAISKVGDESRLVDEQIAKLKADFQKITNRVEAAGLTDAIGQLLRKHRSDLPAVRPHQRNLQTRKQVVASAQVAMIELDDRRVELAATDSIVEAVVKELPVTSDDQEKQEVEQAARDVARGSQELVTSLLKDYDSYFDRLIELDGKERELIARLRDFTAYIDENVLWIRSTSPLRPADARSSLEAIRWLTGISDWRGVGVSAWGTARARPLLSSFGVILLLALIASRRMFRRVIRDSSAAVAKPSTDTMAQTFKAFGASIGLAGAWPAGVVLAAWLAASPYDSSEFSRAIGAGLGAAAAILMTGLLFRRICAKNGLGEKHFRWRPELSTSVRWAGGWATWALALLTLVAVTLSAQPSEAFANSLGRISCIVGLSIAGIMAHKLLRPQGAIAEQLRRHRDGGWPYQFRHVWYLLAVAPTFALALSALLGHYYTAFVLGWLLLRTVWILLLLVILHSMAQRWLLIKVQRRKLKESRERREAEKLRASREGRSLADEGMAATVEDTRVDVAELNQQSVRVVRTVTVIVALIGAWSIWAEALPALGILRAVSLWTNIVKTTASVTLPDGTQQLSEITESVPITLANVGLSALIFIVTVVAARNVPGLLEIALLERLPLTPSGRYATSTITCYIITVVGVVWAFNEIGIGWAKVQWLVAAMTVGLGFGLQEIFANFVSGLILLFERPLRVGDAVTVGTTSGIVTRIRIRATTITDWDRKELVVPNKRFITGEFLNWTLTDSIVRIVLPVGLAHGSNGQMARDILIKIAEEHPDVLDDPPPSAMFLGITSVSMNFELRAFIQRENYGKVLNEMNSGIELALHNAGLQIAIPRQEMVVKPGTQTPSMSAVTAPQAPEGSNP